MFGYSEEDVMGNRLPIFSREDEFDREFMTIVRGGEVRDIRGRAYHKSGAQLHISVTVSPIISSKEIRLGYSMVTREITNDTCRCPPRTDTGVRVGESRVPGGPGSCIHPPLCVYDPGMGRTGLHMADEQGGH
jgi:hypothetical protein